MYLKFLAFCCVVALTVGEIEDTGVGRTIAEIADGRLRGVVWKSLEGREYVAFRGIPYVRPPVGDLRFRPPQPPSAWSGVRDATKESVACPQYVLGTDDYVGDEDCLYANVYTHSTDGSRPTIVWVHGGAFISGDGGVVENGPEFLMDEDVVLVTFNYRIGVLGYLSTGDSAISGNFGNKDQVELLKWVRRNIANFGGDPDKVTLYGYSSGAACVQAHQYSTMSTGLFHRAIYQSGSAYHSWAFDDNPLKIARDVADLVDCPKDTNQNLVDCLRTKPAEVLVKILYSFPYTTVSKVPNYYKLVREYQTDDTDPPFLTETLEQLFRKGPINDVPIITGTTADESLISALMVRDIDAANDVDDVMRASMYLTNFSSDALRRIRDYYLGDSSANALADSPVEALTRMLSDPQFIYHTYANALLQSDVSRGPVYYYFFSFQGRISDIMARGLHKFPLGVCHTDDLAYIFRRNVPFPNGPNVEEKRTIRRMCGMWANFARTGNPTPDTNELIPTKWLPLNIKSSGVRYFEIGNHGVRMKGQFVYSSRMTFWKDMFKSEKKKRKLIHTEL